MSEFETSLPVPPQPPAPVERPQPITWGATLAGIFPILLVGASGVLMAVPGEASLSTALQMAGAIGLLPGYLLILVGVVAGWVRGFPRWSYPYLVYGLLFALYLTNVSTPGLNFFGIPLFGRQLWGLRACVPLSLAALIALLLTRFSASKLAPIFTGVWRDWTRLSFGLYGLLPFFTMVSFDEVGNDFEFPFMLLSTVLLTGGAIFYLRAKGAYKPVVGLFVAAVISVTISGTAGNLYWQQHDIDRMGYVIEVAREANLKIAFLDALRTSGFILGILLAPVWIGLLHGLVDYVRQRRSVPSR